MMMLFFVLWRLKKQISVVCLYQGRSPLWFNKNIIQFLDILNSKKRISVILKYKLFLDRDLL